MSFDPGIMAANLRALRAREGLTQEEVASKVNVKNGTIINYENGKSSPSYETAWRLADLYKVSLGELGGRRPLRIF